MSEENESGPDDRAENLARTAVERSNLYGFLASVFREELTTDFLLVIREPEFREALAEAGLSLEGDFFEADLEEQAEELAVEFAALFLGPGGHVSPHESVHIEGGGGSLWGEATSAVKRYIEDAGFSYDEQFHGLPDHISVELKFMSHLVNEEAHAWDENDVDKAANALAFQRDFLDKHLGVWADRFCAQIRERAELTFYREVASLTADFLDSEREEIAKREALFQGV